jgi:hypothetical protein
MGVFIDKEGIESAGLNDDNSDTGDQGDSSVRGGGGGSVQVL